MAMPAIHHTASAISSRWRFPTPTTRSASTHTGRAKQGSASAPPSREDTCIKYMQSSELTFATKNKGTKVPRPPARNAHASRILDIPARSRSKSRIHDEVECKPHLCIPPPLSIRWSRLTAVSRPCSREGPVQCPVLAGSR